DAVVVDIAQHHLEQPVRQFPAIGMILQQFDEARLGRVVELLVLPQRVVGIEADRGEARRGHPCSCNAVTRILCPPRRRIDAPHSKASGSGSTSSRWQRRSICTSAISISMRAKRAPPQMRGPAEKAMKCDLRAAFP